MAAPIAVGKVSQQKRFKGKKSLHWLLEYVKVIDFFSYPKTQLQEIKYQLSSKMPIPVILRMLEEGQVGKWSFPPHLAVRRPSSPKLLPPMPASEDHGERQNLYSHPAAMKARLCQGVIS